MVEEVDRDDEGGEEEEVEEQAAPRRTAKSKKTLAAPPPANIGGNAGNMNGRARTKEDGTPNSKWQSHEAELMWPEMLGYLEGVGKSPYDVEAHIVRVDPPGPNGATGLGTIDGQALVGNSQVSAGDKLMQVVTDTKHMPTARGPARYEVRFVWKVGSGRIGTGILNLPSPAEIIALRNASIQQQQYEAQQQPPPGAGAPQRPPMPQAPSSQMPPWPHQPPPWMGPPTMYGYGQPPPWMQPQQGLSPEMSAMQAELAATRGALNEALAAAREGRQPRIEGVAAPPPSEDAIAEKVTARVLLALQRAGALGAAPAQPAQTAAAATPAETRGMMDEMFNGVMRTALGVFKSGLEKSVKTAFGMGEPPPEDASAEIAEPSPAAEEFKTPFDVAPVQDVKWPNGDPVRYAADRKTGDISPMGLAFSNPYIVEKGMAVAEGLTGALTDVLKGLARPGVGAPPQAPPPQVVKEIPQGAVDASTSAPEGDKNNGFPSI